MVEEAFYDVLEEVVARPVFLREARLSFRQLSRMARSLVSFEEPPEIWEAIDVPNTLRNKLSHNVGPGDLSALVLKLFELTSVDKIGDGDLADERTVEGLSSAIGMIMAMINLMEWGTEKPRRPHATILGGALDDV